jgi:hypothetical protein
VKKTFEKLPFELLRSNKQEKPWDSYVAEQSKKIKNFDDIIKGHLDLADMPKVAARKEVAKSIYAIGQQPDLLAQRFDPKPVMGSVGEALTELLLPGDEVSVNNPGYDVNYNGNYIEVKSTIGYRAKLSNVQYQQAHFLIMHRFHRVLGHYYNSYLIPVDVIRLNKPERTSNVTIDVKKDVWARGLTITPDRIVAFFQLVEKFSTENRAFQSCNECSHKILTVSGISISALADTCKKCTWKNWEERYAYYFIDIPVREKPKGSVSVPSAHKFRLGRREKFDKDWSFSYKRKIKDVIRLTGSAPARMHVSREGASIYFSPALYPSGSVQLKPVDFDFCDFYRGMQDFNGSDDAIREFYFGYTDTEIKVMIKIGMAQNKGDGAYKKYSRRDSSILHPSLIELLNKLAVFKSSLEIMAQSTSQETG